MDYRELIQQSIEYARANQVTAVASAFILLFFLIWKPRLFLKLFLFIIIMTVIFSLIYQKLSSMGMIHKEVPFMK